ncbi:uncharacterized protein LOC105196893 isoform X1 [Solenopsis invicta]|uniref:uncharacterized protein LOC105196893 isoform X1 n=2 Tax=Solenopsis invicta TaxID=13686 RepID=UPI000595D07B|nr:uncharacterized protein LOC105196893 isoform X1 [Solenopsis invicta]
MPPKKQAISTDQEVLLIDAVKNRPHLWDVSHPMYKRTDLKETLWQEVADIVGPHATAETVRERFINMRTTFMNNEKRIRESKQRCSGKSTDEIYKPKWPFYTSLLFLKKACVQTESSSNLDVLEDNQADSEERNNNLVNSIKSNMYFDTNLEKWVLIPPDTNASLHASHQDDSQTDFN